MQAVLRVAKERCWVSQANISNARRERIRWGDRHTKVSHGSLLVTGVALLGVSALRYCVVWVDG